MHGGRVDHNSAAEQRATLLDLEGDLAPAPAAAAVVAAVAERVRAPARVESPGDVKARVAPVDMLAVVQVPPRRRNALIARLGVGEVLRERALGSGEVHNVARVEGLARIHALEVERAF